LLKDYLNSNSTLLSRKQARRFFKDLQTLCTGIAYPPKSLYKKSLVALTKTYLQAKGEKVTTAMIRRALRELDKYANSGRSSEAVWYKKASLLHNRAVIEREPVVLDILAELRSASNEELPNGLSFFSCPSFGTLVTRSGEPEIVLHDGWFSHSFRDLEDLKDFLAEGWEAATAIEKARSGEDIQPFLTHEDSFVIAEEWSQIVDDTFANLATHRKFFEK